MPQGMLNEFLEGGADLPSFYHFRSSKALDLACALFYTGMTTRTAVSSCRLTALQFRLQVSSESGSKDLLWGPGRLIAFLCCMQNVYNACAKWLRACAHCHGQISNDFNRNQ